VAMLVAELLPGRIIIENSRMETAE